MSAPADTCEVHEIQSTFLDILEQLKNGGLARSWLDALISPGRYGYCSKVTVFDSTPRDQIPVRLLNNIQFCETQTAEEFLLLLLLPPLGLTTIAAVFEQSQTILFQKNSKFS